MYEDAPQLKVWAWSFFAILSLLVLFASFTYSGFGPYAKVLEKSNKNLANALIAMEKDTAAISVVILGSSLTEDALVNPDSVEADIFKLTNKKVNILRVAVYFMNMDLAQRINFFEHIRKNPPQYLFLENFGMNLDDDHAEASIPIPVDASLLFLRNAIKQKIGLNSSDDYYTKWYTFDTNPSAGSGFYSDEFDSMTFKSLRMKKMVVRGVSQNTVANAAYAALQKTKTKVIFLDMPQSDKLELNFMDKVSNLELMKVLEYYHQTYHIEYWPYTGTMPDSLFIDGSHLNYKGAQKYQKWFAAEFASKR